MLSSRLLRVSIHCLRFVRWLAFGTTISAAGFVGAELVELTLNPASFPDPSSVSVLVDAGILGDEEVVTSVSGTLGVDLLPSAINPTEAQVVALDLIVDDEVDVRMGGGFLLPVVTVTAEAGQIRVLMEEPGDIGTIDRGKFDQFGNLVRFDGIAHTSVLTDPIDLSEFEPTSVDFDEISVSVDRSNVALDTFFFTELDIPVDAGLIQTTVKLVVDGALEAQGIVPPANYVWQGPAGTAGNFEDADHWLRGGVAGTNSIPSSIDSVTLQNAIDLDGVREVSAVFVAGDATLSGGTLVTELVEVPTGDHLSIGSDATLELDTTAASKLLLTGGGKLTVAGEVTSPIELQSGILTSGGGQVTRVDVAAEGTLELSTDSLLNANELHFSAGSQMLITGDGLAVGTYPLTGPLNAFTLDGLYQDQTGASKNPTIQFNDTELTLEENAGATQHTESNIFAGYVGGGLFAELDLSSAGFAVNLASATPGDVDGNGLVNFSDFLVVSSNFGKVGDWTSGDFDGSGQVDFADFLILSNQFGTSTAAQSVPEPNGSHIGIGLLVCSTMWRKKRRGEKKRLT